MFMTWQATTAIHPRWLPCPKDDNVVPYRPLGTTTSSSQRPWNAKIAPTVPLRTTTWSPTCCTVDLREANRRLTGQMINVTQNAARQLHSLLEAQPKAAGKGLR